MTGQVLQLFTTIFEYCVSWASSVYDAIEAKPFIYAAFIIILVSSLLLLPLRGSGLSVSATAFTDFVKTSGGGKYWNGKTVKSPRWYKGKYEKGGRPRG